MKKLLCKVNSKKCTENLQHGNLDETIQQKKTMFPHSAWLQSVLGTVAHLSIGNVSFLTRLRA